MKEPHIHLKDNKQEIKISILERKEGQPLGIDENYDLPVKIEYKSKRRSFLKDKINIDTYDMLEFYCSLDEIVDKGLKNVTFWFDEPKMSIKIENINEDFNVVLCYKENEEDKEEIVVKQKFSKKQFSELIEKVHQGCNLWFDDSDLIEFRGYLDLEDGYYDDKPSGYRVAEVEYANGTGKYYSYLCDDENIKTGDLVLVPGFFGKDAVVRVLDIDYYMEEDLPCPLTSMKSVIKKYVKPLSKKIKLCKWDIVEDGLGFELLVNIVFNKKDKAEFSIKDKNAYFNVYLNEYKDVYLNVYKDMLSLKPNEMKITKGLWLTAEKVLHIGFIDKSKKELETFYSSILDKAKETKKHYVGIPCLLETYRGISPKTIFKIALKSAKKWIKQNEKYNMEVLFCCPNEKLYNKFKRIYTKKIVKQ